MNLVLDNAVEITKQVGTTFGLVGLVLATFRWLCFGESTLISPVALVLEISFICVDMKHS